MDKVSVHFTIQDQYITDHARRLWSEGEYKKAYEFLGTMRGMTVVQINRVIMGYAKFKEVGNTQQFELVKDNWRPDISTCHLSQYPNPDVGSEMVEAEEKLLALKTNNEFSAMLNRLFEEVEDDDEKLLRYISTRVRNYNFENPEHLEDFRSVFAELVLDVQSVYRARNVTDVINGIRDTEYDPDDRLENLNQFIEGQKLNSQIITDLDTRKRENRPKPTAVYENGIITRDGSFYRCGSMGHNILAVALGYANDNAYDDYSGLAAALADGCCAVTCNLAIKHIRKGKGAPNEAQTKTIAQWQVLTRYSKAMYTEYEYSDMYSD